MRLVLRVAAWLPALLLLTFAAHHYVRVTRDGLTPWKGGGFGMFSTIDDPDYRRVRVFATTADGQTMPVEPGDEFEYDLLRARYLPRSWKVEDLATRLAESEWVLEQSSNGEPVLRHAGPSRADGGAEAVRVRRIRIEVHALVFDRETRALTSMLIGRAESPWGAL